ncbi:unnamed protein product, partial [Ectocarpus sp. 8 AP-2014]
QARPGRRKFGGIAKALRRHTGWPAGSPHAESTTRGPSKRQRKDSTPRTNERRGGGDAAATHETAIVLDHGLHRTLLQSTRMTARRNGQKRSCCQELDCTTRPSFGEYGSKKAEFCSKHSKPAMVNVVDKKCCHPECLKYPSYGTDGSKKAEFCAKHAKPAMVNVVDKRCGHSGCITKP